MKHATLALATLLLLMLVLAAWTTWQRPLARADLHPVATQVRIDLNQADAVTLALLPGLGKSLALRIIARREEHGPYRSVDDLAAVKGIGAMTIAKLRPYVTCGKTAEP
ncbi:MAG: helix-hairpin-helix domain-containing protein [Phycisphaeraceae bacterium]